jgi:hypothetical protein
VQKYQSTNGHSEGEKALEDLIPPWRILVSALSLYQSREFAGIVVETGEDRCQFFHTNVFGKNLAERGTKICGECKVASFV